MRPGAGNPIPADERYCKAKLRSLLVKARRFVHTHDSDHIKCEWFCREKGRWYFDNIMKNEDGQMKKYKKDNHGDPKNPINGQLYGLFFNPCVTYSTKQPPSQSPYGDTRIKIQADKMVDWAPNLYFSDFYCVSDKEKPHYIQIVMTKPGSEADTFCQEKLIPLSSSDAGDNPFFYWKTSVVISQVERQVLPPDLSAETSLGESGFEDDSASEATGGLTESPLGSSDLAVPAVSGVASSSGNDSPDQQQSDKDESVQSSPIPFQIDATATPMVGEISSVAESTPAFKDDADEVSSAAPLATSPEAADSKAGPSVAPPVTTVVEYQEKIATTCYVACSSEERPPYWLEMFYTDDVDLSVEEEPSPVRSFGRRSGGSVGLKKNTTCNTCNI